MKQETVQAFVIMAIIVMFGFIGWAIWHHYNDRCHDTYRIQGPNWRYEYHQNDNGYNHRYNDYRFDYRYNNDRYRYENDRYRRDGSFRIGPIIEWESERRHR